MKPLVSIIIPCRNEEKFISKCLESLISQDYLRLRASFAEVASATKAEQGFGGQAKENLEILVVDGESQDKTREIVEGYARKYSFIKLLENPKRFTPFGFNIGIRQSKGEIVMLGGAHAVYEKNYISKCVKYLGEYGADNVGGALKTVPKEDTLIARSIAISLSHPFGAGGSYYKTGSKEPRWVDTVFGGCYKKEVFDRVGLFNEKLIRSQDMDFSQRMKRLGLKTLLVPDAKAFYYSQPDLIGFLKHNFSDGIWTTYPLKFRIRIFSWRHLAPLVFVMGLLGSFVLGLFSSFFAALFFFGFFFYLAANFYFSWKISIREKNPRYIFLMPLVFACRHFGYGFGSIWGLVRIVMGK